MQKVISLVSQVYKEIIDEKFACNLSRSLVTFCTGDISTAVWTQKIPKCKQFCECLKAKGDNCNCDAQNSTNAMIERRSTKHVTH